MVGWALVPVPALPPASPLQGSSRARSRLEPGVERWGRGRGRSGHRRAPFYPPSPGAAPKKKGAGGRGVEGGVISSQYQTRPSPYPPPSQARTKAQKVRGWDGSGKGVGRGEHITTSSSETNFACQGQALNPCLVFFILLSLKNGEMLPIFLKEFFSGLRFSNFGFAKGEMLPIFLEEFFLIFEFAILGSC